jgi:hypothetical protein
MGMIERNVAAKLIAWASVLRRFANDPRKLPLDVEEQTNYRRGLGLHDQKLMTAYGTILTIQKQRRCLASTFDD